MRWLGLAQRLSETGTAVLITAQADTIQWPAGDEVAGRLLRQGPGWAVRV
jgi:hypothetical protein